MTLGVICPKTEDESVCGGEGVPLPEDESIETDWLIHDVDKFAANSLCTSDMGDAVGGTTDNEFVLPSQ